MTRGLDVIIAATILAVAAPVMLAAAVAILITDGFPVLYRQVRVGQDMEPFVLLKFRTMRMAESEAEHRITVRDDDRVTVVGRVLRRHKLDELPQLINVLRGEMSLVGPRPEVPAFVDEYPARFRELLQRPPGITDPASVAFRNEAELLDGTPDAEEQYVTEILPEKLELSLEYLRRRNSATDVGLLARTAGSLLPGPSRNARAQRT